MRLLEDHMAKVTGQPKGSNHSLLREALAGFAAAEIEHLIEKHALHGQFDVEQLKADARANALRHYDETYGKDPTGISALFDFDYQYSLFGAYHNEKRNQVLHNFFIPVLMWSVFSIASCLSPSLAAWPLDQFGVPLNATFVIATLYIIYYVVLHPIIGGSASLFVLGNVYLANQFATSGLALTGFDPLYVAIGIYFLSWLTQIFVGHFLFERRAAAFLDNPLQAVILAPLFVWAHGLFGLGLFSDLRIGIQAETDRRIAILHKVSLSKKKEE
ncbi:hypothetical protein BDR26DRAFT_827178 [Obelidium mucronatum]|nr:hypothetical protein BDR26DRAFT_827178 [Obelidium mucronatum]